MSEEEKGYVKRTLTRVQRSMNISANEENDYPDILSNDVMNIKTFTGTFTDQEISQIAMPKDKSIAISELEKSFMDTSKNIERNLKDLENLNVLTPEIKKARSILVPSIMAPNDMQSNQIPIATSSCNVSPETVEEINTLLNNYFNDEMNLGIKVSRWIGDSLFKSGATPILIFPKKNVSILSDAVKYTEYCSKMGRSIKSMVSMEGDEKDKEIEVAIEDLDQATIDQLNQDNDDVRQLEISSEAFTADTVSKYDSEIAFEDFGSNIESMGDIEFGEELIEVINDIDGLDLDKLEVSHEAFKKSIVSGFHKIKKELKGCKTLVSWDYTKIKDADHTKDKISTKARDDIMKSLYGIGGNNTLFAMSNERDLQEGDHPLMMKLPPESCIPVCVPGNPESHIGYFVMIDENGSPSGKGFNGVATDCSSSLAEASVKAMYGQKGLCNGINTSQSYQITSRVFSLTIKKMLESKLNDFGINVGSIDQYNSTLDFLFRTTLKKNKVSLIFVPADFLCYYAFDFRSNGTGKPLLEDYKLLISLRSTLMVANVISSINNSTSNTTIRFDGGDIPSNQMEQTIATIKNAYVSKKMLRSDHDPMSVAKDIISNSISIIPKNVQGLGDLEVTHDKEGGKAIQPDTDTYEKLTDLIVLATPVPASALNELSETEYAKTVISNNLHMANEVKEYQRIVNMITSKLIRCYVSMSHSLSSGICEIINKDNELTKKAADNTSSEDVGDELTGIFANIVKNIKVQLPRPHMAVQKTNFEELENVMRTINDLVDALINEEIVFIEGNDDNTRDAVNSIKAMLKHQLIRESIPKLGLNNAIELPALEDLDINKILDMNSATANVARMVRDFKKTHMGESEDDTY